MYFSIFLVVLFDFSIIVVSMSRLSTLVIS